MAFAFGAATAALTGTLAAALNGSVFPQDFEFPLLIAVYTMVILGGAGSQAGVVLGAILVSVLLEVLREPGDSRALFYGVMLLGLLACSKPSLRLAVVLLGTLGLGFVARAVAQATTRRGPRRRRRRRRPLAGWAQDWVIVPQSLAGWVAPVSYITLIGLVLVLTLVGGWARIALLVPTLYLAAFVWENVMLASPSRRGTPCSARSSSRRWSPGRNGILGEKRVEIV